MTDLTFLYDDHPVRVVTIDGEPWFVLSDLCKILDLPQVSRVKARLDDALTSSTPIADSMGRTQQATVVSEPGMYEVVIRSDKPEAAAFRRWITTKVLPSIRKTGSYSTTPQLSEDQIVQQALAITAARVEKLTAQLAIAQPKADAFDRWLSSNVHYGVAEVAQALHDLGAHMGRNRLFADMAARGWIYRDPRGDWRPYQAQIETGRLAVKLSRCENSRTGEEFAAHTVRITTKGAVALADLLGVAPADLANALADDDLAAA